MPPISATTPTALRAPQIAGDAAALWAASDIVFKVRPPSSEEVALMREGTTLIDFIWPAQNPDLMQQLAGGHGAGHRLPARTLSRAQKMDALTSTAGSAGYRAVIEGGQRLWPLLQRPDHGRRQGAPAKVFIAGAGVAGLPPLAPAANLGAIVRANDTRAEVADQVKSLGGEFVKVDYEEEGSGGGGLRQGHERRLPGRAAPRCTPSRPRTRTSSSPPR